MLYPLWTAKPGSGCSTTALTLATQLARRRVDVLLVDLGGDLAAAAAIAERPDGVTDWLAAPDIADESLRRLEQELAPRVTMLPLGSSHGWNDERAERLVALLRSDARTVIVDVSIVEPDAESPMQHLRHLLAAGDPSILITRPCYLAIRRAEALPIRPTAIALIREPGRMLDRHVVAQTLGVPVIALIDHDPAVARAVDGGSLVRRPPRALRRQVEVLVR